VLFLQAGEEWGIPPWEVENGPAHWFIKWKEYATAREAREKHARRKT
jgi:hypothetical protein